MIHVKPPETDIALGNCIRQIPLSILFTRHPNPQLMIVCHHCSVCFTFAIKAINNNKEILIMSKHIDTAATASSENISYFEGYPKVHTRFYITTQ